MSNALQTTAAHGCNTEGSTFFAHFSAGACLRYIVVFSVPAAFSKIIMDTTYTLEPLPTHHAGQVLAAAGEQPAILTMPTTSRCAQSEDDDGKDEGYFETLQLHDGKFVEIENLTTEARPFYPKN